ncbi:hypothetical protein [Thalassobellus suaedae]|uniref:Uncharacterized protein n=1 Tax=Thalassobellus suaedae TaxID=3074124 RepID=A0ABY9Y4B0_9FLAO|nr:hypothetical protein RHP49_02090 [Flavobacteriaceae bacterium HL-DH10]
MNTKFIISVVVSLLFINAFSQNKKETLSKDKGLSKHPFLYVGEWDTRKPKEQSMFIVRDGKLDWQYSIPMKTATGAIQEFDDVTMLSNGNIVFACMSGAGIITPEKNLIWEYHCEKGTETHSIQPIGKDSVMMMLNANSAKILIFNTAENKLLKEILIPTTNTNTHGQFRHVRITNKGTIMVPHLSENKVVEYTMDGEAIWSVKSKSPWAAIRLKNGNTLISGDRSQYTREVNPKGETVWELTQKDVPFTLYNTQTANRLANGNTVITNWCAGIKNTEEWANTVQVFEVTPSKEVVWKLSSWDNPDLGPSTYIQLLDEIGNPDNGELQR